MERTNHHFTKMGDGGRELGWGGWVGVDFTEENLRWGGGLGNDGCLPDVTSSMGMGAGLVVGKGRGWPDILFT